MTMNKNFSVDHQNIINGLSAKPAALARSIIGRGIDLRTELLEGRNPFICERPDYMRIACTMLLNGGFTKDSLKREYRDSNLNVTPKAAKSYVSVAFALLEQFGVIHEVEDSTYVLRIGEFA
jgi:hypothetical protein